MRGAKLDRNDIVGRRIQAVLSKSTIDPAIIFSDFLFVLDSGVCFRLPGFPDDELESIAHVNGYQPMRWPVWPLREWWHYRQHLFRATVADIMRPTNDDDFVPDSVLFLLSSGWCLWQVSSAPKGANTGIGLVLRGKVTDYRSYWSKF